MVSIPHGPQKIADKHFMIHGIDDTYILGRPLVSGRIRFSVGGNFSFENFLDNNTFLVQIANDGIRCLLFLAVDKCYAKIALFFPGRLGLFHDPHSPDFNLNVMI